jgi:predicted RNase H-like HicB family nuclease
MAIQEVAMQLQRTIHAVIRHGEESGYVAECRDLHAVTQGATLDEVASNLREVIALALDGEDLATLGLAPSPVIIATFELELAVA